MFIKIFDRTEEASLPEHQRVTLCNWRQGYNRTYCGQIEKVYCFISVTQAKNPKCRPPSNEDYLATAKELLLDELIDREEFWHITC